MYAMTVRELNANVSRAIAMVEAGEIIDITKNGRVVAEIRSKPARRSGDPEWQAAFDDLKDIMDKGISFGRTFSHDERNG